MWHFLTGVPGSEGIGFHLREDIRHESFEEGEWMGRFSSVRIISLILESNSIAFIVYQLKVGLSAPYREYCSTPLEEWSLHYLIHMETKTSGVHLWRMSTLDTPSHLYVTGPSLVEADSHGASARPPLCSRHRANVSFGLSSQLIFPEAWGFLRIMTVYWLHETWL